MAAASAGEADPAALASEALALRLRGQVPGPALRDGSVLVTAALFVGALFCFPLVQMVGGGVEVAPDSREHDDELVASQPGDGRPCDQRRRLVAVSPSVPSDPRDAGRGGPNLLLPARGHRDDR